MSDGGAKEQQQGGFFGFCLNHSLEPFSNHSRTILKPTFKPHQTHIQTQHRTPSNPTQTQLRTIIYFNEDGKIYIERYNPSV